MQDQNEKTSFCCFNSGKVCLMAKIDRTGYCPGTFSFIPFF